MGWGWPRATVKLKERMRLLGEYPPRHFLEFYSKPIKTKRIPQMSFILLRLIAIFGHHSGHHIPKRVRYTIYIPPTYLQLSACPTG